MAGSFLVFDLSACASTNSLMGDHLSAANQYRDSARQIEKSAHKQAVSLNHLIAAKKFADAGQIRIRAASEYAEIGNPVQEKGEYERASADFVNASRESILAEGATP